MYAYNILQKVFLQGNTDWKEISGSGDLLVIGKLRLIIIVPKADFTNLTSLLLLIKVCSHSSLWEFIVLEL
tara:strand:+ start:480 stop:692 length:213 start_codon:yes stop_codon:yes gene_type:complete